MIRDLDIPQERAHEVGRAIAVATNRIAMAIRAWPDDVREHGSPRTLTAYADILGRFRAFLQAQGYDLADPHTPQLAQVAKTWAELRRGGARPAGGAHGRRAGNLQPAPGHHQLVLYLRQSVRLARGRQSDRAGAARAQRHLRAR